MHPPTPSRKPIDSLAPETLAAIFHEVTNEPNALMQLALVCRSWRDIVFMTGELWHHIKIDNGTSNIQLRKQLELSGETLLTLDLQQCAPGILVELAGGSSLRPIVERVSSLKANIPHNQDTAEGSTWRSWFVGHSWPQLQTLLLVSQKRKFCMHLQAPNLKKIHLYRVYFHDWDYIGLGSTLCELRWVTHEPGDDVTAFIRAAARCPNLWSLALHSERSDFALPELQMIVPLWPKLAELVLECMCGDLAGILAILFQVPHLKRLHLQFRAIARSARPIPENFKQSDGLHELTVDLTAEQNDGSGHMLRQAFLQGILGLYDPTTLENVEFSNLAIPIWWTPVLFPRLQRITLTNVVLPINFVQSLERCLLIHDITFYDSKLQDVNLTPSNMSVSTSSLVFSGSTLTGVLVHLRTLALHKIVVFPEFLVNLSQHPCLNEVYLTMLPMSEDPISAEADWPDLEAITPLSELCRLNLELHRQPNFSYLTPGAQYIVSAAAQLARRMPSGEVLLWSTPLRAADIARILSHPDRILSNVEIQIRTWVGPNPQTLDLIIKARVDIVSPACANRSIKLTAGIRTVDLADVADTILGRFSLDSDIKNVTLEGTALEAAKMAIKQNPNSAGLGSLMRRAGVTAGK